MTVPVSPVAVRTAESGIRVASSSWGGYPPLIDHGQLLHATDQVALLIRRAVVPGLAAALGLGLADERVHLPALLIPQRRAAEQLVEPRDRDAVVPQIAEHLSLRVAQGGGVSGKAAAARAVGQQPAMSLVGEAQSRRPRSPAGEASFVREARPDRVRAPPSPFVGLTLRTGGNTRGVQGAAR